MIISMKEFLTREPPKNFDDMQVSGENAIAQLKIIKQCLENFNTLKGALEKNTEFQSSKQKTLEK